MSSPVRNARIGAVALSMGAMSQVLASMLGALAMPWAYAGWLLLTFGALCLCEELGATRPLNRAGLIMLGVGFLARTVMVLVPEPLVQIRAELAFAIASLIALQLWSAALMHRTEQPKAVGLFGALLSGFGLAVMIAAHILVGSAGYLGFAELFAALHRPDIQPDRAMIAITAITAVWASVTGLLLWSRDLKAATWAEYTRQIDRDVPRVQTQSDS